MKQKQSAERRFLGICLECDKPARFFLFRPVRGYFCMQHTKRAEKVNLARRYA